MLILHIFNWIVFLKQRFKQFKNISKEILHSQICFDIYTV